MFMDVHAYEFIHVNIFSQWKKSLIYWKNIFISAIGAENVLVKQKWKLK